MALKLLTVLLFVVLSAPIYAGRYDGIINGLDDFMGGGAVIKHNNSNKFVAVGENGNRFRMDLDGHGSKPHAHLESPKPNGELGDATGTPHHIYFKE